MSSWGAQGGGGKREEGWKREMGGGTDGGRWSEDGGGKMRGNGGWKREEALEIQVTHTCHLHIYLVRYIKIF